MKLEFFFVCVWVGGGGSVFKDLGGVEARKTSSSGIATAIRLEGGVL